MVAVAMDDEWPFKDPKNCAAFVCGHVIDGGAPVLLVVHDPDGDWQFLCGGDHDDEEWKKAKLVCLEHMVNVDASVAELGSMWTGHSAARDAPGQPWRVHDDTEDTIREHVARFGWHVCLIPADETGPAFAYTIGLHRTFGQPEIICFGLALETLHAMINIVGEAMKAGVRFEDGSVSSDILDGYECQFRAVRREHYREYFGYGIWYHDGLDFPALQLVWPDRNGRYPWQDGASPGARTQSSLFER